MEKIVFFEPTEHATPRTIWKIKRFGSKGWKIIMKKDSIACLKDNAAGTLLVSVDVPVNYFQPWRGWIPTKEIKLIGEVKK